MIHVDHGRVAPPNRFESMAFKELESLSASVLKDRRPKFRPATMVRGVREALFQLFHGKCVYCETPLERLGAGQLDLYRPRQNARGHSAPEDEQWSYRHHYWWLSWEWRNLYLSCEVCNRNKGTWFPVLGERAPEGASWESLEREQRLLVDPCVDDPEKYFVYDEGGLVHPKPAGSERGEWRREQAETTIKLLGLNRSQLVEARRERMGRLESSLWEVSQEDPTSLPDPGLVGDAAPYAGACRHLARQLRRDRGSMRAARPPGSFSLRGEGDLGFEPEEAQEDVPRVELEDAPGLSAKEVPAVLEGRPPGEDLPAEESVPVETSALPTESLDPAAPMEQARPDLSRVTALLQKVTLANFRAIQSLSLDFSLDAKPTDPAGMPPCPGADLEAESPEEDHGESDLSRVGWWVLLGENGSGKSSVLQAVALGLAGQVRAQALLNQMGLNARKLQRRVPRGAPPPGDLRVELELSGEPHRIVYRLQGNRLHFEEGAGGAQGVVRAYGTSRLPPRRQRRKQTAEEKQQARKKLEELVTIESLFNPHETLIDPEAWLLDQDDPTFNRAALALADLFGLPEGAVYKTKRPFEVKVKRGRDRSPLSQLSDGYQALTGLVAHLMAAIPKGVSDLQEESGIVLIDELGVHLHPRWRMKVVHSLRTAFPRFQFLATTHEPLCLRGLEEGEVGVMYHLPSGVSVIDKDVPPLTGLRVDQILTSRHFGLNTTIDPELDREFEEYFQLLGKKRGLEKSEKKLEKKDDARYQQLEAKLSPHRVLGYTRQDQLVYELIGEYLGSERELAEEESKALKAETKDKVLKAWRRVGWSRGGQE